MGVLSSFLEMDEAAAEAQSIYSRFLDRIKKSGKVWGLVSDRLGWAFCPSLDETDRDVLVVWSTRAGAEAHVRKEWAEFRPHAVSLSEFRDTWLKPMKRRGIRIGPDWNDQLCGAEVKAADLAADLADS